jgi:hypothetical protein
MVGESSYIAKLDTNSGIFSFVEVNKFKQITHITLPLKQGDDAAIKMYLASRLSLSLNTMTSQHERIVSLEKSVSTLEQSHRNMEEEMQQTR